MAAPLRAHGIAASLPAGFEGRIFVRPAVAGESAYPVAHFATVPLPTDAGDFGSGVVTRLGANDIFVSLFEYGPESVGTALFAREGMPRTLAPSDFRTTVLRRGLGGQSGTQWFFTEAGRPFTLYVVLGSHVLRSSLVPRVNDLIGAVSVTPSVAPASTAVASPGARWN